MSEKLRRSIWTISSVMMKRNRQEILETSGIRYLLERKRITRMHMYVRPPEGEVLVTAPAGYPLHEIERFVSGKADWIRKHQQKFRERPLQGRLALKYETGELLYFWGKPYRLEVVAEEGRSRTRIEVYPEPVFGVSPEEIGRYRDLKKPLEGPACSEEGKVILTVPSGSTFEERERAVRRKYRKILEKEAGWIIDYWCRETGLSISSWHSRYMKTRWGSLSVQNRRVDLNIRLAEKPVICLIYVALHEVAHVEAADHGPRFKAILTEYMPSWSGAEKILKN